MRYYYCKMCGCRFDPVVKGAVYCVDCYDIAKRIRLEKKKKKYRREHGIQDLCDIANAAAKEGISYGNYVAKNNL